MRDLIFSAIGGYLLGTIPSADIASRLAGGPDLRQSGSGNPGATNAASVLGPKFGLAVLVVDIAKGATAANLGRALGGRMVGGLGAGPALAQVASTSAVIGHCHPVWSGFRGGKGVATGVGQVLATFPAFFPFDIAVALVTAVVPRWKQRAFTTTTVASVSWVGLALLWWRRGLSNLWGPTPTLALPLGAAVSSTVIFLRFRAAS